MNKASSLPDFIALSEESPDAISLTSPHPHFFHLWEAIRSFIKGWKQQRLNRRLKRWIAILTEEAACYAAHMCKENLLLLCDILGANSVHQTWRLLRYPMEPSKIKTESNKPCKKMFHSPQDIPGSPSWTNTFRSI
ncbi:hypothetical protein HPB48_001682 [Haemaphysalis longicornis]|uniref:Uncharacterized protein n=1 Tax=Haemaphysalis longicornis TaxID=44386 RepID=A0A9J6GTS5_HAELO|nr:hypothetical protein HPB48_001682 [Haemaphysalis longicornis]